MNQLEALRQDAFREATFGISVAEGLRDFLCGRPEVARIRDGLLSGEVTEEGVERFVRALLANLSSGTRLSDESALAAIAVALETVPGFFADSFLSKLASVKVREIPLAPKVAALSLAERRSRLVGMTYRSVTLSTAEPGVPRRVVAFEPRPIDVPSSDETLRLAS